MSIYEIIITVILLIAYSVFSVWAITKFKKLSTEIAGSLCLAAGGSWGLSIRSNRRCGDLMDREGFAYYRRHCTGRRNIRKLERVNVNEI